MRFVALIALVTRVTAARTLALWKRRVEAPVASERETKAHAPVGLALEQSVEGQ